MFYLMSDFTGLSGGFPGLPNRTESGGQLPGWRDLAHVN